MLFSLYISWEFYATLSIQSKTCNWHQILQPPINSLVKSANPALDQSTTLLLLANPALD